MEEIALVGLVDAELGTPHAPVLLLDALLLVEVASVLLLDFVEDEQFVLRFFF